VRDASVMFGSDFNPQGHRTDTWAFPQAAQFQAGKNSSTFSSNDLISSGLTKKASMPLA
jgi:hypothetical protein